jgi:hypothetical protein
MGNDRVVKPNRLVRLDSLMPSDLQIADNDVGVADHFHFDPRDVELIVVNEKRYTLTMYFLDGSMVPIVFARNFGPRKIAIYEAKKAIEYAKEHYFDVDITEFVNNAAQR